MNTLNDNDLRLVVTRLPKDIRKQVQERHIILAGGFIRSTIAGERPSDIDLFGETKEQLEAAALALKNDRQGSRFHKTDNAFTVLSVGSRMPVQYIHRWLFNSPTECLQSFDFTVAQAAVWFADGRWVSVCHPLFYPDLAARRLTYCSPPRNENAGGSLLRVRKFLARGYNIQAPSLAAVIARLCMAVKDIGGIKEEERLSMVLCGLLREVDPLIAVEGLDLVNEHEELPI